MPHTQISSYAGASVKNFAEPLFNALTGIRVNPVSPGNVAAGSSLKVFEEIPAYREFARLAFRWAGHPPDRLPTHFVLVLAAG